MRDAGQRARAPGRACAAGDTRACGLKRRSLVRSPARSSASDEWVAREVERGFLARAPLAVSRCTSGRPVLDGDRERPEPAHGQVVGERPLEDRALRGQQPGEERPGRDRVLACECDERGAASPAARNVRRSVGDGAATCRGAASRRRRRRGRARRRRRGRGVDRRASGGGAAARADRGWRRRASSRRPAWARPRPRRRGRRGAAARGRRHRRVGLAARRRARSRVRRRRRGGSDGRCLSGVGGGGDRRFGGCGCGVAGAALEPRTGSAWRGGARSRPRERGRRPRARRRARASADLGGSRVRPCVSARVRRRSEGGRGGGEGGDRGGRASTRRRAASGGPLASSVACCASVSLGARGRRARRRACRCSRAYGVGRCARPRARRLGGRERGRVGVAGGASTARQVALAAAAGARE